MYKRQCYDYPNNRTTSEIVATVPEQFTAISNGALVGTSSDATAKTRTFHWRHDVPHSAYLITLAAGEFAMIEERAGTVPVTYYVAPGREDDARRAFGNTPKMIQFFERVIGVPYPYAKYAQVAVSDFIFGGMENTSATTQTDSTLHDARAHLDFKSDPLDVYKRQVLIRRGKGIDLAAPAAFYPLHLRRHAIRAQRARIVADVTALGAFLDVKFVPL